MHWRRKWQPTPVFLPGESRGQRSLVGCSPWGRTESDTTEAMWQQLVSRFSIHSLKIILFIYLVLPVLGLHAVWTFSLVEVLSLLIAVASFVVEHRL